ncbi:hypothetical protein Hdeb2414_s0007g00255531 [Helianthus debilis subsp. tardiflorus]
MLDVAFWFSILITLINVGKTEIKSTIRTRFCGNFIMYALLGN